MTQSDMVSPVHRLFLSSRPSDQGPRANRTTHLWMLVSRDAWETINQKVLEFAASRL